MGWKPHKLEGCRGLNNLFRPGVTTELCRGDTNVSGVHRGDTNVSGVHRSHTDVSGMHPGAPRQWWRVFKGNQAWEMFHKNLYRSVPRHNFCQGFLKIIYAYRFIQSKSFKTNLLNKNQKLSQWVGPNFHRGVNYDHLWTKNLQYLQWFLLDSSSALQLAL